MTLRILFRVDAAVEIGSGHVMRCLCLADELRRAGHDCRFVCREQEGDLIDFIENQGYGCAVLPRKAEPPAGKGADWLDAQIETEIRESRAIVEEEVPDWLIVDHYALDASWERAVVPEGTRIMVIDDLADRPHACDLLLDQGLVHHPANYASLVPNNCRMLLGPAYTLLRPEFHRLRPAAQDRDRNWPPERILVNFGGVDACNSTRDVLEELACADLPANCAVEVVMGRNAPHIDDVRTLAATSHLAVRVHVDIANMAEMMLHADLAIGAAGTTSWERCCLGLPSLMLSVAENQLDVARALEAAGAAVNLGALWEDGWRDRLIAGLRSLSQPGGLRQMSATCLALIDGTGTERVVRALTEPPLNLRRCIRDDAERVWKWREADGAPRFYRTGRPTPWDVHLKWFEAALADDRRVLFIVEENGRPIAHLRFDLADAVLPEVSLAVDPALKGENLGLRTVAHAVMYARKMDWPGLSAVVHQDNTASAKVFERNGFRRRSQSGAFVDYVLDLREGVEA